MNRAFISETPATGEPLYDIFNDRGLALLLGVSHPDACRIIDERQAEGYFQWAGALHIVRAHRGPDVLVLQTSIIRVTARLEVWCEIERLLPSGLSVEELFAKARPALIAAIKEAAIRAPNQPPALRPLSVGIDVGAADPSLSLTVRNPGACAADMVGQLGYLQRIADRVIDGERACGQWRMGL